MSVPGTAGAILDRLGEEHQNGKGKMSEA